MTDQTTIEHPDRDTTVTTVTPTTPVTDEQVNVYVNRVGETVRATEQHYDDQLKAQGYHKPGATILASIKAPKVETNTTETPTYTVTK